ncbi:MAG: TIM barrel protein [Bacteroidetes bacterium]|nr:TIM barrel protein [Bacteroidota bacterium]MDA1119423.1 TIM barrel protein [Bacteroidota bacterium]
MKRKEAIKLMTAGTLGIGLSSSLTADASSPKPLALKGNINHSVCRWCYRDIPLEQLADAAKEMGLVGVDILTLPEWKTVIDRGLTCTMASVEGAGIVKGFNDPNNHKDLQNKFSAVIPKAAESGLKNIICFSGNRNGMDDQVGLENCAIGLDPLIKLAEKHNVMIMMELLNSKVNHKDYMCDFTPWGVKLVEKIGSSNFKLLYDIYHMQIMEGDIIATIRDFNQYFGHYHTGGVPGRNEIDETQELYYPAIMQAIVDVGHKGFVAQEFVPASGDPLRSLRESIAICDV